MNMNYTIGKNKFGDLQVWAAVDLSGNDYDCDSVSSCELSLFPCSFPKDGHVDLSFSFLALQESSEGSPAFAVQLEFVSPTEVNKSLCFNIHLHEREAALFAHIGKAQFSLSEPFSVTFRDGVLVVEKLPKDFPLVGTEPRNSDTLDVGHKNSPVLNGDARHQS